MPIGAAIVASSVGSAVIGGKAAKKGAKAQRKGTQAAIDEQRRQFDIILGLTQPGREVGNQALNTLAQSFIPGFTGLSGGEGGVPVTANTLSDIFSNLPGVQFLSDQARRGVEASGAAVGDPFGGNVQREIGFQTASLAENQVINRLLQLAGFGPQATGQAVAGSSAASGNISQLLASLGGSQAAGIFGQAGSINNALQGGLNNFLLARGLGLFGSGDPSGAAATSSGGGGGTAGAALGNFSDRRLKTNIRRIGTVRGYPWYSFDYIWGTPAQGVMADEIPAEFVLQGKYAMVDYGKLLS